MIDTDRFIGGMIGEYRVNRMLGQSQLGKAYLARHTVQGHKAIVITCPVPEGMSALEREQLSQSIAREGGVLTRLTHLHILPIYACGMQADYVYLVTALVEEASLAQSLKQHTRFTPQQTLSILKQLAAALDYAHGQGVVHGMLSLSNVIVSSEFNARIAGFGLLPLLDAPIHGQKARILTHFSSKNGNFPGQPEYISPERLFGLPVDARSDIYALGVMLFELLSGVQPFSGVEPLDIALQRLQQPVPSVHAVCPEVPAAFDLVLRTMLERDPNRRVQSAGGAASAFERVIKTLDAGQLTTSTGVGQSMRDAQNTLPPTVDWLDEAMTPGQASARSTRQLPATTIHTDDTQTIVQTSPNMPLVQPGASVQAGSNPNSLGGMDPFAWWSGTSNGLRAASSPSGRLSRCPPVRANNATARARPRSAQQGRRKVITLLGAGTAAGILMVSGISLARLMQSAKQSQPLAASNFSAGSTATTGNTTATGGATANATPGAQHTMPTAQASATKPPQAGATAQPQATSTAQSQSTPTAQPQATPTAQPQSTPTAQPQATPTPKPQSTPTPTPQSTPTPTPTPAPSHTGTVIGHTGQATNSAVSFTNPADGKQGLLVHLGNGNWAACEVACTHVGIAVNYDSGSQKMVCPAHGATFNPASGFSYVAGSGPGSFSALPNVTIRVNSDGTITTG